ncbi:MAG: hypothetical protein CEE38_23110 [Planctomycetes bacterium B3_Pla]|nr:MAG: hypothetical protein CEE38_23110 [Planctomycetes bacterium B3_Pla]
MSAADFFNIFYYMWPGLLRVAEEKTEWNDRLKEGKMELGTTPNVAQDVRIPIAPHVAIVQRRIAHDDPIDYSNLKCSPCRNGHKIIG